MSETADCVVIGAGVVGLAVARALALQGRSVLVLEALGAIGSETSSRNSEVIHAGIYYPTGSWKARLCVHGSALLYAYCTERDIPHRRCGKLIVACTSEQTTALQSLAQRAKANGVADLQWLSRAAAQALEPALECSAALLSPGTGIVDSHALMLSLQGDMEHAGGLVVLHTKVVRAEVLPTGIALTTQDGTCVHAQSVVNAAGLHAPNLAQRFAGLEACHIPRAGYAKGSYFTVTGKAPFQHLIYPVPLPGGTHLGVHLTLDLAGQAKFGPDEEWVGSPHDLSVDPSRADGFYAQVRTYWPQLPDGALAPGYAGIRPKIHAPHEGSADFVIQGPQQHGIPGLVNLFGIESPGLTSALAIGEMVGAILA